MKTLRAREREPVKKEPENLGQCQLSDSCMVDSCSNTISKLTKVVRSAKNLKKYLVNNITFALFRMDVHKNKDELGPVIFCTKEAEELEKMARSPNSVCSCSGM